jgi:soluble lytic murein transglycosylase-like protein
MGVAVCLLATSLLTCEWHRAGTAPRLHPKPIEVAAPPVAEYRESVAERIGFAEPDRARFGELVYAAPPPAIYGENPEPPKSNDKRGKRRAEPEAKREPMAAAKEFKSKKTKAVASRESLAYAAPNGRKSWLAGIFNGVDQEVEPSRNEPSTRGSGYDAVRNAARRYGPGGASFEKLARDITYTESRGRCGAVSSANALGVMQTKYGTAQMMGYKGNAQGLKNCRTGAEYGVKYLAYCHGLAKGDIRLTSICYNQGHGVLTNPRKYGKRAQRKEAVNYVATMRSRGWRM